MKVHDLFTLNRGFRNFKVLCGETGVVNTVKNIVTVEVDDAFRWLKPGDFVVTKGYFFKKKLISFISFVEMLAEKQIAGLGVKLGVFISELPLEILSFADEHRFPILSIPTSVKYSTIVPSVLYRLSGKRQYAQYVLHSFQNDLHQLTESAYHLKNLIALLASYLGCHVSLFYNGTFQYTSPSDTKAQSGEKNEKIQNWIAQNRDVSFMKEKPLCCVLDNVRFLLFNINSANDVVAFLAVELSDESLTDVDSKLIAKTIPLICIYLLSGIEKSLSFYESPDELFAKTLFGEDVLDLKQLRSEVESAGMDYSGYRYVVIAEFTPAAPQEYENVRSVAAAALEPDAAVEYCAELANRLVIVVRFSSMPNQVRMREVFTKLSVNLTACLVPLSLYLSVSTACFNFVGLRLGCQNADFAMRRGKSLMPESKLYFFESFVLPRLLKEMQSNPILQKIHGDIVGRLAYNDELRKGDLLKTLVELVRVDFNITAAAQNLYLHRNSISQRMEKINRILEMDVNDVRNRLMIQIAVKLLEI